ncbi:hypothetical protein B0H11DRAFT_1927589 [Mycena galericulata]|nr:hypothetical protein B0H11DRAFT_1927589 [Mycena galericulata]
MDCQFSFGPNGAFFCKSDTIWAWSDNNTLPEPLRLILEDPNHPQANKFPYDVAFPVEPGMFSMSWKTVRGEDYYEGKTDHNDTPELFLGPRYSKLAEFMRSIAQAGEHTTRTVFGPNASYFTMSSSGFSWQNLPSVLEHDMVGRMKKGLPTTVTLGMNGAFVVLYGDGNVTFDVATHYPAVDAMIRNSAENARRKGIAYISLSPYAAGQYYLAYGDGSASWNLPTEWSLDVTTVSKSLRPVTAVRIGSTLPALGGFAAGGSATSAFPSFMSSPNGHSPTSPGSGSSSTASTALHGAEKLWHAYQKYEQQNGGGGGSSSPFGTQSFNFDPSNMASGFDPNSFQTFTQGLDPNTLSNLAGGLDPNTLINTINNLFGGNL